MADISAVQKQSTSMTVKLINLDLSWTDGLRYVYWAYRVHDGTEYTQINDWSSLTLGSSISVGDAESTEYEYTGLTPGTTYDLKAQVYAVNTGEKWNFYSTASTSSTASTPAFQSFAAMQYDVGVLQIEWQLMASNVIPNTTQYLIYARVSGTEKWWLKTTDVLTTTYNSGLSYYAEGIINVDEYGDYEIMVVLNTNGESTSTTRDVFVDPGVVLSPSIVSIERLTTNRIRIKAQCLLSNDEVTYRFYYKTSASSEWIYDGSAQDGGYICWWLKDIQPGVSYDYYVQAMYNGNGYYEASEIVTVTLKNLAAPTNLKVSRGYKNLSFSWDSVIDASEYNIALEKASDSYAYVFGYVTTNHVTIDDDYIANEATYSGYSELTFGFDYKFRLCALNKEPYYVGSCLVEEDALSAECTLSCSTLPAPPTIDLKATNGTISVDYCVLATSGVDSFVFELFSDSTYSNSSVCESITVTNSDSSNLNPSGSTSFSGNYTAGTYYVRARTYYNSLGSITETGAEYVYGTITVDSQRPDNWYWSNTYTDTSGNTSATISSNTYIPMDELGLHPVTAVEWNNFTARINEFRVYRGYTEYSFTTVQRGNDFASAYNEAVEAIKGIAGYGTYLNPITSSTALSASLFVGSGSIQEELNAII